MTSAAIAAEARAIGALGRRSVSVQFRQVPLVVPTFVLPLILLAAIASGTSAAQRLPGFPDTDSYLAFVVPGTIVQGAMLAGLTAGVALAADMEGGFFDRMLLSPVRRVTLISGRLLGAVVLALVQTIWFMLVAMAFGATYPGGVLGTAGAAGLAALTALGLGGIASAAALRTGSMSLMQGVAALVFVLLFTAPAFIPRDFLSGALQDVSPYNPLTYLVEGIRALLQDDPSLGDPWLGLAVGAALAVTTTALSTVALRARLRRT